MDRDLYIIALEAQNAKLTERVADLEKALFDIDLPVRPEWKLSASEARIFALLVNRETVTKEAIMTALYDDTFKDRAEVKIADVFICKARRKLKPFGIEIETLWGIGYRLVARETFQRAA